MRQNAWPCFLTLTYRLVCFKLYFAYWKNPGPLTEKWARPGVAALSFRARDFLKVAGLRPGLDCFVSGASGRGQHFVRKTRKCKTEWDSLQVKWTELLEVQPLPLKGFRVSSGSGEWSSTAVARAALERMCRTASVVSYWFFYSCKCLENSHVHLTPFWACFKFAALRGARRPYPIALTIFLLCFGCLELKIVHPSVVSLVGFFTLGNIKFFVQCRNAFAF